MDNIKFEWDSKKEKTNIKKHGLDFSTVAYTTRENESIIRIISARSATREEKEEYYRGYN